MSNSFRAVVAIFLVAFTAACAQQDEEVVFVEPVMAEEPTTKY